MNKIIAVAAPAIIGVAGYLYKIWAEKIRSRKLVLFYMLEIHYVLKVLPVSTDGLVGRYLEYCKGLLKNAGLPIDENYDEMIEKIAPHIHVYFENLYSAIPSSLDAKFQESLIAHWKL
jgi:hypothetical protein